MVVLWHCFIMFRLWPVWVTSAEIPCHLFFSVFFQEVRGSCITEGYHGLEVSHYGGKDWCSWLHYTSEGFKIDRVDSREIKHSTKSKTFKSYLVGGFNPFEKYVCQIGSSRQKLGVKIPKITETTLGLFPFACLGTTTGAEAKLWLWWIWIWRPRRQSKIPGGSNPWGKTNISHDGKSMGRICICFIYYFLPKKVKHACR